MKNVLLLYKLHGLQKHVPFTLTPARYNNIINNAVSSLNTAAAAVAAVAAAAFLSNSIMLRRAEQKKKKKNERSQKYKGYPCFFYAYIYNKTRV